jgi:hypothetical protein
VDRAIFPHTVIVVGAWPSPLGWAHRFWLEGAVDVVLDELAVLERMLDGGLVVRAWRVQELLEVTFGRTGLGWVTLRA